MVKKSDWKTIEMPEQTADFILEKKLTAEDIEIIKQGRKPEEMEDKWFMYYENGKLYVHRSWTGYCIFIADISDNGIIKVVVNNDPKQVKEVNDLDGQRKMFEILINGLIGRRQENQKLMKEYIQGLQNRKQL